MTTFIARVCLQNALKLASIENKIDQIEKRPEISEDKLWITVQKWRIENGKQMYQKDERMCDLAEIRVGESQEEFNHDKWYEKTRGIQANRLAENLIKGYTNEEEALQAWLDSPDHKKNLGDDYTKSCIKCSETYCAQEFIN